MAATDKKENKCKQCLNEGITLLPLRWGYRFQNDLSIFTGSRLLRAGYVYILDNNGKWYGYVVTEGRYLKQFNVLQDDDDTKLPVADSKCYATGDCAALSSFIRIPQNPKKPIDKLWLAFSPAKWTKNVLTRHKNNEDNAKTDNMIEIPVSATQVEKDKESSDSVPSLGLSESQNGGGYDLWSYDNDLNDGKDKETAFYAAEHIGRMNPYTEKPYQPDKTKDLSGLKEQLDNIEIKTGKRVLNVFFNDINSQLIDLNEMMVDVQTFLIKKHDEKTQHKVHVGKLIKGLEYSLKSSAKTKVYRDYDEDRVNAGKGTYPPLFYKSSRGTRLRKISQEEYNKRIITLPPLTAEEHSLLKFSAEEAMAEAWEKYEDEYESLELTSYLNSEIAAEFAKDLKEKLDELIAVHMADSEGDYYKNQLLHNFDTHDVENGIHFMEVLLNGIGITAEFPDYAKKYAAQLTEKNITDKGSFLLRSFAYNHDPFIKVIAANTGVPWQKAVLEASWSAILGSIASSKAGNIISTSTEVQNNLKKLTAPLTIAIHDSSNKPLVNHFIGAVGFHSQKAVVRIEAVGRQYQIYDKLSEKITTAIKDEKKLVHISNSQKHRFISGVLAQLQAEGKVNLSMGVNAKVLVLIDVAEFNHLFTTTEFSTEVGKAGALERTQQIGEIAKATMTNNSTIMDLSAKEFDKYVLPETDFKSGSNRFATVGIVFQAAASFSLLHSALTGSKSNNPNDIAAFIENSEAHGRLAGALGFLYGGQLDRQVSNMKLTLSNPALNNIDDYVLNRTETIARRVNLGAAGIFAAYDLYHTYDQASKGNEGVAFLYFISSAAGFGSVYMASSSATIGMLGMTFSWAGILLIVAIAVGIVIVLIKNDPLEEWLENSIWGQDNQGLSYAEDLAAYQHMLKSIAPEPKEYKHVDHTARRRAQRKRNRQNHAATNDTKNNDIDNNTENDNTLKRVMKLND